MKKLLFFICTLLCANVLMAQTRFWVGDIQYEVTSPAEVKVNDANSSITTAIIPETVSYDGINYSVTSIEERAFYWCSRLTSVTIPNSVTSIGDYAFYWCSSLTSIDIPNSVTSIGYSAFAVCSSLTSVTIPNSVTSIGDLAFSNCSSLTSVIIPNSVTSIGGSAFAYCSSLTSITIPNSVISIGNAAFSSCNSLTSVDIPNSVTSIGRWAFEYCSSLTSVILPNNANIYSSAFESTGGINVGGIYYGGKETVNIGNYTFNNVGFIKFYLNGNATTITPSEVSVIDCDESLSGDIVIPSILSYQGANYSVTSIGGDAFEYCSSLTSVTIPNSVTSIGGGVFHGCSSLTSVTIPNSVTSIGGSAFSGCNSLTSVIIPNSVTSIGGYAFSVCSSLTSVTCLAETAPSLDINVFASTPSNKTLSYPCGSDYSSWESATDWASVECILDLGNSLTYFPLTFEIISEGERTMKVSDCDTSATVVEIPARVMYNGELYDVTSIRNHAFNGCSSLTSVTIPNSVTSIGNYALYGCSSLTSVTIPNSVTSIGNSAFDGCSSLTSIDIPNSVTSIRDYTFYNCSSLTSITIGNSVTSIGNYALYGCSSLTSVTIPNSVTSIGNYAFRGCSSLTSVTIPNSVTSIGYSAFRNCSSLTSVTIPNSVTSIGDYAFYNCSSLTSVDIPNSVNTIGIAAFYNCGGLTSVTIPNSVTSIGNHAFEYCSSLTSVTIPNSVTSIGERAFSDCSSLTSVTIPNSVTSIGNSAFSYCRSLTSVTIPNSVTSIENGTFYRCNDLTSVTIPNSVTSIGDRAFEACGSLTSVTIPNSVTSIGIAAFYNCGGLTSVTIPNSVTSIGNSAFYWCGSLTSVTIPNSVTSIGNSAFYRCNSLTSVTCLAETAPSLGNDVFSTTPSNKTLTVPFNASGYTSDWGNTTWQKIYHKINEGEIKTLTNAFEITEDNKRGVINEGVLRITQSGQLINQTSTNVGGIIEIETPTLANDKWSFIGAPFNNYKLKAVKPGTKDISISLFDYTTGNWAEDFATIDDSVGSGEGFFAWSFAAEPTVFTTYGDGAETYNFETTPAYSLNNDAVNVTRNLTTHTEGGNWLALSNPYTFKLDVEKFLSEHGDIKGGEVYRFNGSVWTPVSEGEINMTEGFFVNFETPGTHSVSFSKLYIYEPAKSKVIEAKDYITLNVAEGENVSKLRFAQNPKAKQGDDIFDANKLFSPLEITEPYFVTDGVALVKEEVKEYPYTATLNIRNYETKEVTLSIDNIPEGVNVYLIDNGYEVKMNGGVEYNTRIIAGENADRFKVLFKKQHRLERIKDNQITITNNNRQISVKSDKTDLNIEVYNQLGQKVFSTNEYNFTLSEQPAGSYVIKAYQGRYSESKKIIID